MAAAALDAARSGRTVVGVRAGDRVVAALGRALPRAWSLPVVARAQAWFSAP